MKIKISKAFDNNTRENNLTALGFGEEVGMAQLGLCPFCHKAIKADEFRDEISKREFQISALCQACQDKTFGK